MTGRQVRGSVLVCGSNEFSLIGVDGVYFSHPDERVCKGDGVSDVLVLVPRKKISVSKHLFMRWEMIQMVY